MRGTSSWGEVSSLAQCLPRMHRAGFDPQHKNKGSNDSQFVVGTSVIKVLRRSRQEASLGYTAVPFHNNKTTPLSQNANKESKNFPF